MTCFGDRLVLVGEAPGGHGSEPTPALEGLAGRKLARMMDVPDSVYLEHTVRKNLFETPDEGKVWYPAAAKMRAIRMAGDFRDGDRIVLLGAKVAAAFGFGDQRNYVWFKAFRITTGETFQYARVPHPSGRNRMYNDAAEREQAAEFLREAIRGCL